MIRIFSLVLISLLLYTQFDANAQQRPPRTPGNSYQALLQRADQPAAYINHMILPSGGSSPTLAVFYRLDYDFLPFLRKRQDMTAPFPDADYFAPVRMGFEVFEGHAPERRRNRDDQTSVFRNSSQDTVWAAGYDETKSRFDHVQGVMTTRLSPGEYNYELQLARGGSVEEQPSRRFNSDIPDYAAFEKAVITTLKQFDKSDNRFTAGILNYGENVLYGQNFELLILLPNPEVSGGNEFTVSLYKMEPGNSANTTGDPVFTNLIDSENIFFAQNAEISKQDGGIRITMEISDEGYRYGTVSIPNQEFENARYKIVLDAEGSDDAIAEQIVNSQWLDMPVSLYNLDVAIDMLQFIAGDSELDRIKSGSASEKEQKFRTFWNERDPTPDTEFNELMMEYYKRIDDAYENYTTLETPGYETDQGQAYILYGPPMNVDRRFPTDRPTREIWEYPDRTLIFEATSGFGDFRLISES